jgi:hypothetical protein
MAGNRSDGGKGTGEVFASDSHYEGRLLSENLLRPPSIASAPEAF